jgi:LysR family transcriptional regulator, carnitine catabolism transcriptional activator
MRRSRKLGAEPRGAASQYHSEPRRWSLRTFCRRPSASFGGIGLNCAFSFKGAAGVRRAQFFRFSLMVIRAGQGNAAPLTATTWSSLQGQTLISLSPSHPHQQLIDKHLVKAGVKWRGGAVVNLLDTQIALVEAEEGIAIIPSFGLPACRGRKVVMSRLINPVVHLEFHQISNRAKKLPAGADEFAEFLKSYIAGWAGQAGVL